MQLRHGLVALAAAVCVPVAVAAQTPDSGGRVATGGPLPPETRTLLREVRQATRAYLDVAAARAAGYVRAGACADDPKYGGMGIHYGHPGLLADGVLDPLKPEVLVYQPARDGTLRLGAVEYFRPDADQDLHTDPDRPSLFGLPFDGPMLGHDPEMPVHYDLHVWLYRPNPAGLFAAFNPRVECPAR